jgi:hypothetical protein
MEIDADLIHRKILINNNQYSLKIKLYKYNEKLGLRENNSACSVAKCWQIKEI